MEKFLFKKIELWLLALGLLFLVPICVTWGMKIVEKEVWPWSTIEQVREFVAGDEFENTTLISKLKSEFGGSDRFKVDRNADNALPQTIAQVRESTAANFEREFTYDTFEFKTSVNEGYYLFYGAMTFDSSPQPTAILVDIQGEIVRRWTFPFRDKSNRLRWLRFSPNGVVVSNSADYLRAQDWCGKELWQAKGRGFHHEMHYGNGRFTLWFNDEIVSVDELTGEVTKIIDMRKIVLANPDIPLLRSTLRDFNYFGDNEDLIFDFRQQHPRNINKKKLIYMGDNFHQNKAAVNDGISDWFPIGSIAISMRQIDLVAVIDPNTGKVLWHETFNRQHDPIWMEDGLLVYNNRRHFDYSQIEYVGFDGRRKVIVGPETMHWHRKSTGNSVLYDDGSIMFQGSDGEIHHLDANLRIITSFISELTMQNGYYLSSDEARKLETRCQ